jgi:hypothetical protein
MMEQSINTVGLCLLDCSKTPPGLSERCAIFQGPSSLPVEDSLDLTNEPHPRFLVQGHILSIGGDALKSY